MPTQFVLAGSLTAIDTKTGGATVKVIEAVTEPMVAVMTEVPGETPVTTPPALPNETVATLCDPELQITLEVMSRVLPLAYVPVAISF